jgi:MoaA/NifB/PqqE/SkfB family radical SAM enzyme
MKYLFDGQKLLWHMDRVHDHFRDGKRIAPLHIDLGATKTCNAKCVYCYGIFQEMTQEIIPHDSLVNLFRDAPALGVKSMTITGDGEPTLNPAIWEALEVGKAAGLDIGFATNGIKLDDDKIKILLETCVWCRFNVSAVQPETYQKIHGVKQWERVEKNILSAVRIKKEIGSKCTLGLQMVLIPDALDQIIPEAEFAVKNGLDYFVIKQFSDPGCESMSRFALSWYDKPDVLETLKKAEAMSTAETKIVPKWKTIATKGDRPYDRCVDCALLFQISGSSKCYPCGFLFGNEKYCYGDLKTQSLGEILKSEQYWAVVKEMRDNFNVHTDCVGSCRHNACNEFIWNYLNPPDHITFI